MPQNHHDKYRCVVCCRLWVGPGGEACPFCKIERMQEALCEMLYAAEDFLASSDPRKPIPGPSTPLGQPTTVADCQRLTKAWRNAKGLVEYKAWLDRQAAEVNDGSDNLQRLVGAENNKET